MEYIYLIIIGIAVISALNIVCFFIGAKVGQKVAKNETITIPNPVKTIQNEIEEYKETKEAEKEKEYYDVLSHNIDTYDGTSIGQMEIPR